MYSGIESSIAEPPTTFQHNRLCLTGYVASRPGVQGELDWESDDWAFGTNDAAIVTHWMEK